MEIQKPPAFTILYMYCTGCTEMPQSHTWQPLSMCRQISGTYSESTHSIHYQKGGFPPWFYETQISDARNSFITVLYSVQSPIITRPLLWPLTVFSTS